MKNPCRDCPHLPEDKNGPVCQNCTDRVAYVRGLGSLVDMQPLVNSGGMGGKTPAVGAGGYDAGADEMRYKTCRGPACLRIDPAGVERPFNEFSLGQSYKDGHAIICKKCRALKYQQKKEQKRMENQAEFKSTKTCKGEVCLAINPNGVDKPISEFGSDKKSKDGLKGGCRRCVAWSMKKSALKKKGVSDPKPQDYGYTLDKPLPTPNRFRKGPSKSAPGSAKVGRATAPAAPAVSAKEKLKNHFVKMMDTGSSLSEAYRVINGERQDSYGNPEDSFGLIAQYWGVYLAHRMQSEFVGARLSALDVAHMMTLFKIARMLGQAPCRDNYIDAQGYLAIAADRLLSLAPWEEENRGEGD